MFSGGTPSLAPPTFVPSILETLEKNGCNILPDAEITLEANPTSLPDLKALTNHGITRLSIGVQSLASTETLRSMNREHTSEQAIRMLEGLVSSPHQLKHGFTFDLMFGMPNQTREDWAKELELATPFAQHGGHLSLYELTLEPSTPLKKAVRAGRVTVPDEDTKADMYEAAVDAMRDAGLEHYEISSFAKPGRWGAHNYSFWMGADLVGIGPGAHGRITDLKSRRKVSTRTIPSPRLWEAQVRDVGTGVIARDELTEEEYAVQLLAGGLRTKTGLSARIFRERMNNGLTLDQFLDLDEVNRFVDEGFLEYDKDDKAVKNMGYSKTYNFSEGSLRPTEKGMRVIDSILPMLTP
ncbi:radical SAM enzyme [Saitoella complicata NRRL Y-17804]|uniref:radical SAM enzyme n=1 Tax=Saitoella complicata (strain BCRC 22490 / CBS 7301 / JCM 7358 / NBRC 10748 / NRRL Y-17804) TaxID=698492 RepID=UPI0008674B7C|nr:radical SAM enzyme [Saitoella complicata NRRL Y-17804]ODQ52720.1 radical SAM enzyme [Saitoella complicata NRRL Y-17804]